MKTETKTFKFTFTEPLLGSASGNRAIHEEFIASKAPDQEKRDEEALAIAVPEPTTAEKIEKAMTVFPRDEKGLHLWDYVIRGFYKEQIKQLIELGEIKDLSTYAHKGAVDNYVLVNPRRIYLMDAEGKNIMEAKETLQRPLRATTMQGDRVALANSEMLPPGTNLTFTVKLLVPNGEGKKKKTFAVLTMGDLESAIELGSMKGFGQWRSGGYGRFTWEEIKAKE